MVFDKVQEVISFRQSKSLENYIKCNTRKKNQAVKDFEKDFYKLLKIAFYGKKMKNVRNRKKVELCLKEDILKNIKEQSK